MNSDLCNNHHMSNTPTQVQPTSCDDPRDTNGVTGNGHLDNQTATTQELQFIAFRNNEGKIHTHARCGFTRRNQIINTPRIVTTTDLINFKCKRCSGHGFMSVSPSNVVTAWEQTAAQMRRIGRPISEARSYTTYRAQMMMDEIGEDWS